MYFYLSLGSNIDAEKSSVTMLRMLCQHFEKLGVFPFRYTEPEGIVSDQAFVNSLAVLWSDNEEVGVKKVLNYIEITMGRDRNDPLRSVKARHADIDILGASAVLSTVFFERATEPYVQQCFEAKGLSPDFSEWGLAAYQRPSTVYLDAVTGKVGVVEDEFDGFKDWVEATLAGE